MVSGSFSTPVPPGRHHDRRSSADYALGGHVDLLGAHGDEGSGREGLVVDIRGRRPLEPADNLDDFLGHIHPPAVRVHVEDQRVGMGVHGLLHATPDHIDQGRHDILPDGQNINLLGPLDNRPVCRRRTCGGRGRQSAGAHETQDAAPFREPGGRRIAFFTTVKHDTFSGAISVPTPFKRPGGLHSPDFRPNWPVPGTRPRKSRQPGWLAIDHRWLPTRHPAAHRRL